MRPLNMKTSLISDLETPDKIRHIRIHCNIETFSYEKNVDLAHDAKAALMKAFK